MPAGSEMSTPLNAMMNLTESFTISLPCGWKQQLPDHLLLTDEEKMLFVIDLARWNVQAHGGGPFAAAVFEQKTGQLISIGVNRVVSGLCSLAHAEAVALALAQQTAQQYDLSSKRERSFELVTSGQPCIQCFGMVWWSGVRRLVSAARSTDIERLAGFDEGPIPSDWAESLSSRSPLPPVEVLMDVCREQACEVLTEYAVSGQPNYSPGRSQAN